MIKFLRFVWQLPQNLLALFLIGISRSRIKMEFKGNDDKIIQVYFVDSVFGCGVSLGDYVLLDRERYLELTSVFHSTFIDTINHEHGHQIQSLYFGPLYLPVIGISSSVFNNLWDRLFHRNWLYSRRYRWYYSRFPEKWADKLGKVERNI